jgi:L-histidine N-alpha-methyltransferase
MRWRAERVRRARPERDEVAAMAAEVRDGLRGPFPSLPCKYFYDDRGSELFEEITRLPEYYQTRTEEALLEQVAGAVLERTRPRELVELGSGAGRKIRVLLDRLAASGRLESCLLMDVNALFLSESAEALHSAYPAARVRGVLGDFTEDLSDLGPGGERLLLFFAGTLGNLHPDDVPAFFRRSAGVLEPGDGFLVGVDLVKDKARLEAAYNDAAGVTARFNLNILRVLNARLGADFDLAAFEHVAFYDEANAWIEMRVRARRPCRVLLPGAGLALRFERGQELRTELSCKYTRDSLEARLAGTGLALDRWFTDRESLFGLALLRREGKTAWR